MLDASNLLTEHAINRCKRVYTYMYVRTQHVYTYMYMIATLLNAQKRKFKQCNWCKSLCTSKQIWWEHWEIWIAEAIENKELSKLRVVSMMKGQLLSAKFLMYCHNDFDLANRRFFYNEQHLLRQFVSF